MGLTARQNALSSVHHLSKPRKVEEAQHNVQNGAPSTPEETQNGEVHVKSNGKRKRIGVMTSGGDSPGMNAAVRSVVRMSIALGCESYAIFEGYEGLVQGGDLIKKMTWEDVRGWLSEGGTLIGTARCMTFKERLGD